MWQDWSDDENSREIAYIGATMPTSRPSTPEGFWETEMPTTPEAIKKRLIKKAKI